jgi:hypothetical protein
MAMNPIDDEPALTFVQVIDKFEPQLYAALWNERKAGVARGDGALDAKDVARMIAIATDMVLGGTACAAGGHRGRHRRTDAISSADATIE